jgi:hypothetical protein
MAIHGDASARRALREHVEDGEYWADAIEQLSYDWEAGRPAPDWEAAVAGLDEVLIDRFGSDLEAALYHAPAYGDVWKTWPRIAELMEAEDEHEEWRPPMLRRSVLAAMPTPGLLASEQPRQWREIGMVLGGRPEDVDAILEAAHDPEHPMRPAAIRALGALGRPELLPLARALTGDESPRPLRIAIGHAVVALPFALGRDLALEWLPEPTATRRRAAAGILAAHAGANDVEPARAALENELELGDQYIICSLAEALARVPEAGPSPALSAAYERMVYSYGRHFVVAAIAATDPTFGATLAPECRYDCESVTRELAGSSAGSHSGA